MNARTDTTNERIARDPAGAPKTRPWEVTCAMYTPMPEAMATNKRRSITTTWSDMHSGECGDFFLELKKNIKEKRENWAKRYRRGLENGIDRTNEELRMKS